MTFARTKQVLNIHTAVWFTVSSTQLTTYRSGNERCNCTKNNGFSGTGKMMVLFCKLFVIDVSADPTSLYSRS